MTSVVPAEARSRGTHPVAQKISLLRRRLRLLLAVYAVSRVVTVVVAVVGVLALCDWLIHFEDPGLRLICSLLAAAALVWAVARFAVGVLGARFGDVEIAQHIERRFPWLNDRLASTVEFLNQGEDSPGVGSPQLRRAVVVQAAADVEHLDVREALDRRPVVWAALWAVAVLVVFGLFAAADPGSTRIAVTRLVHPLGDLRWPRQSHLAFRQTVTRVALDQPFEVEVIDANGRELPETVMIEYRPLGTDGPIEQEPMQRLGETVVARKERVSRPFSYRAVGGDDDTMGWTDVEVVEPPRIEELAVTLHFPEYTGWPQRATDKHIRALVGTQIALSGTTTKPLKSAAIQLEDGTSIPARIDDDGYRFSLPGPDGETWTVEQSGRDWFSLEGTDGLIGETDVRYELRAVPDSAPSVSIEEPTANIYVTAEAVVPVRVVAKDDLALKDVTLRFTSTPQLIDPSGSLGESADRTGLDIDLAAPSQHDAGETAVSLFRGPDQVVVSREPMDVSAAGGESQLLEHRWELASLGLRPGDQLTFHATADDYLPQRGQSSQRRLTIVTSDELKDRLAQRQSVILNEVARVLRMQQDSRSRTTAVEIQLTEVGRLDREDVDQLQAAELTQRQVQRALASDAEGIRAQVAGLLSDLANNNIEAGDIGDKMNDVAAEIDRLAREHLPVIARELTSTLKSAQSQLPAGDDPAEAKEPDASVKQSLATAGENQDAVVASLEQMLAELTEWDQFRRVQRDLAALEHDQRDLSRRTMELGGRTISQSPDDLNAQQVADLKKLVEEQEQIARRFDGVTGRMRDTQNELDDEDPLSADTLGDALHHARREGISGQMHEAGQDVGANQTGQAVARQEKIADGIREMIDIIEQRREHELDRLVKKLREAEQELAGMRERQEGLKKRIDEARAIEDEQERRRQLERLSREQRELEEEARRFARRLQRLQADSASRATASAAGHMSDAGQQAGDDQPQSSESAASAQQDLDEAQQQLAQRRQQAEMDLAIEQLERIEQALVSLHARQQQATAETRRLDDRQKVAGRLSRGEAISLRNLAREQEALAAETRDVSETLSAAEAFRIAIEGAAGQMSDAATGLTERQTGQPTQKHQQRALDRIALILAALNPETAEESPGNGGGGEGGGGGAGGNMQADAIPEVAHLKLIKLLQIEYNERTEQLENEAGKRDDLSPEQQREYALLSEEQGHLADVVRNLMAPAEADPETDVDSLPDFPDDDLELDDALRLELPSAEEERPE